MTSEPLNVLIDYDWPAALVEPNYPCQHPHQMPIYLYVDYGARTVKAETREYSITGTPMREWHGHVNAFSLPDNVDASELRAYVVEHVEPILRQMADAYEDHWNGSNWVARFGLGDVENVYNFVEHVERLLADAPTFDDGGLWDVDDWLGDDASVIGITADTTDEELDQICEGLKAEAIGDNIVLDGDLKDALEQMRQELRVALYW